MKYRSVAAAALMVATPALAQESNDPIKLTLHIRKPHKVFRW